jgi:hypothetical protein
VLPTAPAVNGCPRTVYVETYEISEIVTPNEPNHPGR